MAQLLVRNIDDEVMDALRRRARQNGLSLEEVARRALRDVARPSREELRTEIDRIRALSTRVPGFDSTAEIRKLRDGIDDDGR